jgi:hypothetical protein
VCFQRCLKQPKEDVLCGSIGAIAKVADRHGGGGCGMGRKWQAISTPLSAQFHAD